GAIRIPVKVLEPKRELGLRAVHMAKIKNLLSVGAEELVEHFVCNKMDHCACGRDGAEETWFVPSRSPFAKDSADQHLPEMRVLPLAYRIYSSSLADQASHSGIFVPNIAKLDLRNLSKGVVSACVLRKAEQCKLANQLPGYSRTEDVESELGS